MRFGPFSAASIKSTAPPLAKNAIIDESSQTAEVLRQGANGGKFETRKKITSNTRRSFQKKFREIRREMSSPLFFTRQVTLSDRKRQREKSREKQRSTEFLPEKQEKEKKHK